MKHPDYPYPNVNVKGVKKLLNDLDLEIAKFQPETPQEIFNIVQGLEALKEQWLFTALNISHPDLVNKLDKNLKYKKPLKPW